MLLHLYLLRASGGREDSSLPPVFSLVYLA
jgi:hypothetical protein